MSEQYWVVGGTYTSTEFNDVAPGKTLLRLGPFDTYDEAKAVWRAKSMENVDEAYARFHIEKEEHDEWWVVGGVYTGTDFKTIARGEEERIGPFQTYEEARKVWWQRSSANVDDAYARYRIDHL